MLVVLVFVLVRTGLRARAAHRQKGFALEPGAQSGFGHYQAQEVRTLAGSRAELSFKTVYNTRSKTGGCISAGGGVAATSCQLCSDRNQELGSGWPET
jgi:hypothetical protein